MHSSHYGPRRRESVPGARTPARIFTEMSQQSAFRFFLHDHENMAPSGSAWFIREKGKCSSFHLNTDIRGFEMSNDFRDTNLPFLRCEDSVGSKDPAVIRPSDAGRRREQAKTLQLVGANRRQDEHESNLMIWYSASCNTTPAHPLTHALEIETIDGQSCRIFEIGSIDCG